MATETHSDPAGREPFCPADRGDSERNLPDEAAPPAGVSIAQVIERLRRDPETAAAFDKIAEISQLRRALKRLREESGLTQDQVAERMAATQSIVSRIENGLTERAEIGTILRFVSACGGRFMIEAPDRQAPAEVGRANQRRHMGE